MIERLLLNILSANDESFSQFNTKIAEREEITELERFYQLGTSINFEIKTMSRPLDDKKYDLPSIVFGEFSYNISHKIFQMFIRELKTYPKPQINKR